jgi:hypothetical protein
VQRTEYPEGDIRIPAPVIGPGYTSRSLTDKLVDLVLTKYTPRSWYVTAGIAFTFVMILMMAVTYLFVKGTGIWGINVPVGWAFAIINFVGDRHATPVRRSRRSSSCSSRTGDVDQPVAEAMTPSWFSRGALLILHTSAGRARGLLAVPYPT